MLIIEPILKEISKKSYYKAMRKYGLESDDCVPIDAHGAVYQFRTNYYKKPIYRKGCGISGIVTGRGIVGYKYYKKVGEKVNTMIPRELYEIIHEIAGVPAKSSHEA